MGTTSRRGIVYSICILTVEGGLYIKQVEGSWKVTKEITPNYLLAGYVWRFCICLLYEVVIRKGVLGSKMMMAGASSFSCLELAFGCSLNRRNQSFAHVIKA